MSEGDAAAIVAEVNIDASGPETRETAIQKLLRAAIVDDKLGRGLRESIKSIEKDEVEVAFLAESCDNDNYVKLVEAICKDKGVKLVKVADGKELGEWAGLCKVDRDGSARKVVGASLVVVKYGVNERTLENLYSFLGQEE